MLWLGCRYLPSVNTICGRIMIGLSLSSVSKHNMWSYYDWVVVLSSVSKHNMRSYYDWVFVVVVRQLTQYVVVLWLGCCCCLLSVNTICGHIIIGLSSVSKHNIWSYYDWVYCLPSVNTICGRIMIGLSLLSSVSKHNMWSYYDWVVVVVVRL
jgi:hypothetical protein